MTMQLAAQPGPSRSSIDMPVDRPAVTVAGGGSDFWDVGNPGVVGPQLAADHGFSDVVSLSSGGVRLGRVLLYGMLAVTLSAVGYFAYQMLVNEKDPVEHAQALLTQARELLGLEAPAAPAPAPAHKKPRKTSDAAPPLAPQAAKKLGKAVAGNPYWSLPNKLLGAPAALNRTWTAEEEETWRAGVAHKFSYQRFKTIQDVRERRLKGSEKILWEALQDKKFWLRGFAAVGIAELNVEVSLPTLEAALGKARSELVAGFFERFVKKPSAGQAFVLRQLVRLVDEKGRLIALRGIANSKDSLREVYLAAATQDPGRRVQRWITSYLAAHPLDPERFDALLEVVHGARGGAELLAVAGAKAAPVSKRKAALHLATDEDLDKELAEFDTVGGAVQIYDEEQAPAEVHADPDRFEYQDALGTKPIKRATLPASGAEGAEE